MGCISGLNQCTWDNHYNIYMCSQFKCAKSSSCADHAPEINGNHSPDFSLDCFSNSISCVFNRWQDKFDLFKPGPGQELSQYWFCQAHDALHPVFVFLLSICRQDSFIIVLFAQMQTGLLQSTMSIMYFN